MLMDYKGEVTVKIDGIAASAASVIAMAGTEVLMSPGSMMMIHNPATVAWGDTAEMQRAIEMLATVKDSITNAYDIRTGMSRAKLSDLMDAETWMDANKAVELGFADGILQRAVYDSGAAAGGSYDYGEAGDGFGYGSAGSCGGYVFDDGSVGVGAGMPGVPRPSMMYSRAAVRNSLMDKLAARCMLMPRDMAADKGDVVAGRAKGTAAGDGAGAGTDKGAAGGDDAGSAVKGRSCDEIRERLDFMKKFI
jgi:ATP-dependent Clp protease protease subunit